MLITKRLSFISVLIVNLLISLNCISANKFLLKSTNTNTDTLTLVDIDGNVYSAVIIGSQVWMAENLRTTKFNNGTEIPLIKDENIWKELGTPAYCWYNNDTSNISTKYGALFNWDTVNSGNLCPDGWHVPTDYEWFILENFIDSTIYSSDLTEWRGYDAGNELKDSIGWNEGKGVNSYGFSALPAGDRLSNNGKFGPIGMGGFWWSATEADESIAWLRIVGFRDGLMARYSFNKKYGFSKRCLKD